VTDPTNLNALADRLEAGDPLADVLADWGAYASDYFKDKWGLSDDVARLRQMDEDRSAAARILRAVAAAPGPLREYDAAEAQVARLRQLAYDQHRAIGALRRLFGGGGPAWDDTGAEELWWCGESDEGWELLTGGVVEQSDTPDSSPGAERREGSTPSIPTTGLNALADRLADDAIWISAHTTTESIPVTSRMMLAARILREYEALLIAWADVEGKTVTDRNDHSITDLTALADRLEYGADVDAVATLVEALVVGDVRRLDALADAVEEP
jgi:hypothetical protein